MQEDSVSVRTRRRARGWRHGPGGGYYRLFFDTRRGAGTGCDGEIGLPSAWQEVYSIDESFIGLQGTVYERPDLGHEIRAEVLRCTSVPVRPARAASAVL